MADEVRFYNMLVNIQASVSGVSYRALARGNNAGAGHCYRVAQATR